jgi:hypothetical protein
LLVAVFAAIPADVVVNNSVDLTQLTVSAAMGSAQIALKYLLVRRSFCSSVRFGFDFFPGLAVTAREPFRHRGQVRGILHKLFYFYW